ncbi:phage tail tape measure protein [Bacillus thuringiensis]|uniref:phage tail tape measure protein n=2 Tax=Bacillus thuringiensis TaxID=1428 RepID=UPI0005B74DBD|nr:phage tail tape measure protein [Bacillus thuringiensis]KIP26129.1 phage tail tape measure protein, TP901 family, core region [Bacillus thuringiensis serovar morrisoni]NUW49320.1 phage tail tape measure protein [Bacillus thuringiensis]
MEVFKIFGSVMLRDQQARAGLRDLDNSARNTSNRMNKGFSSVIPTFSRMGGAIGAGAIAMGGMAGIAVGVSSALIGIVSAGASYEQQMSKVKALSGASAQEMKLLDAQAKELGSTTKFSASEAADGMAFLGMAGYKTKDIMSAMPGLLDLAAAGALDLGQAADITSNIMAGFGLSAEKTGHASDVLAKAASNANTDVGQLGEAMKYLAPTAHSVGWSMEESTAAVMAMSDAGIQGSLAGQAFGSSLTRLAKPTKAMQKEMDKLGLTFFDSQGKMKPLPQLVGEIEGKTKGLTMEQKAAALSTIFGAEAYKHWAVLLEKGGKKLGENTKMLEKADGAAKEMADTMNDNLIGSWNNFLSKLEGVAIAIYEKVSPGLRMLVDGMAGVLEWTLSLMNGTAKMSSGMSDAFKRLGDVFNSWFKNVSDVFNRMGAMFQKHQDSIMKVVDFLVTNVVVMFSYLFEEVTNIWTLLWNVLINVLDIFFNLLNGNFSGAWQSFKNLVGDLFRDLGVIMKTWWEGLISLPLVQYIVSKAKDMYEAIKSWGESIKTWFFEMPGRFTEWLSGWWDTISTWLIAKTLEWGVQMEQWGNAVQTWFSEMPGRISEWFSEWWNTISQWFTDTKQWWSDHLQQWGETLSTWWDELPQKTLEWLGKVAETLDQWNQAQIEKLKNDLKSWWNAIADWFEETKTYWTEKLESWGENISTWFSEMPDKISNWFTAWGERISNWYDETKENIKNKLTEWGTNIQEWFESIPGRISDWFTNWWSSISSWYDETKNGISEKLNGWGESISTWFSEMPGKIRNWFSNWWKEMSDWFTKTKNDVKQWLDDWLTTIKDWFTNVPNKSGAKKSGGEMIKEMIKGSTDEEPNFTEKLGKMILKVIGLVLLAVAVAFLSAGKELIKYIVNGVIDAGSWLVDKLKEVANNALKAVKDIDWKGLGKDLINWIIDGLSSMGGALASAFKSLFTSISIPTPKFSVNGSLNPVNWASQGLPSVNVRWAKNGALVKPGTPTLVGVGDAPNYDEVVLPLKNDTLGRIGREIMETMPNGGNTGSDNGRPIELVVNLDKKELARELYEPVTENQERAVATRKLF